MISLKMLKSFYVWRFPAALHKIRFTDIALLFVAGAPWLVESLHPASNKNWAKIKIQRESFMAETRCWYSVAFRKILFFISLSILGVEKLLAVAIRWKRATANGTAVNTEENSVYDIAVISLGFRHQIEIYDIWNYVTKKKCKSQRQSLFHFSP